MTGLNKAQLDELVACVHDRLPGAYSGPGYCLRLYRSVALVVYLMRENPTQSAAGAAFGVSQSTASRRWDDLREVIGEVLAGWTPEPGEAARNCTVLVDGTLARTWDWRHRDDLYSGKHRDTGFNLQVVATMAGRLLAIGEPVPGARHDAYAYTASGIQAALAGMDVLGDLGYLGCGPTTGTRTPPAGELSPDRVETNKALSRIRAHIEHAISRLKNWKILGSRYRGPLHKYPAVITTVFALHSFKFEGAP